MDRNIIRYDEDMVTFDWKITNGIHEGASSTFNVELEKYAMSHNISVPGGYYPALLNKIYLENDFAKFRKIYPFSPIEDDWNRANRVFSKLFSPSMVGRVLTYDEAVARIELSASPGYPFNRKFKSKRDVVNDGECNELLRSVVSQIFSTGKFEYEFMGEKYQHCFWQTSPKSEIRVIEKYNHSDLSKRKTRTFMCADIIVHIVGFMLYSEQNDQLLNLGLTDSWSAMGINPWYGGWNKLSQILTRNGSNEFECWDASHMEASLGDAMQKAIYDVRNGVIYGSEIAKNWFYNQISCSLVIDIDGNVCLKFGKNPSGSFNTLSDNTFALILIYLYTMAGACETDEELVEGYRKLACKCMGDDSIVERSDKIKNFKEKAWELGFVMELEAPPGPLTQCSFLSSGFVFIQRYNKYVQSSNYEKVMSNVFMNFKKRSWRYAYVKLCAARKLFWAFEEKRRDIDILINYVYKKHYFDMENEIEHDNELTFVACISQLMSDSENRFLVFGDE